MSADDKLARLELLYETRLDAFVRTARAITRDLESARDVVQDAFASAVAKQDSFRHSGELESWVWPIVVRKALDQRRRDLRRRTVEERESMGAGADDAADDRLLEAIRELPDRQRLTLFLRYYADLDYATIAEILEVRPGTVGASLHAAQRTLKVRLIGT
jgi:RNA polymerase sigma factor (sigma-70 family)